MSIKPEITLLLVLLVFSCGQVGGDVAAAISREVGKRSNIAIAVRSTDNIKSKLLNSLILLQIDKRAARFSFRTEIDASSNDILTLAVASAQTLLGVIPGVGPFLALGFTVIWSLMGPKFEEEEVSLETQVQGYVQEAIALSKTKIYEGKLIQVHENLDFYNRSSMDWFNDNSSTTKRDIVRDRFNIAYDKVTEIVNVGGAQDYLYAIISSTTLAHQLIITLLKDVTRFGMQWDYGASVFNKFIQDRPKYAIISYNQISRAFNQFDGVLYSASSQEAKGEVPYVAIQAYPSVMIRACFLQRTLHYLRTELYPYGEPAQITSGSLPQNTLYYQIYGELDTASGYSSGSKNYNVDQERKRHAENCVLGRTTPYREQVAQCTPNGNGEKPSCISFTSFYQTFRSRSMAEQAELGTNVITPYLAVTVTGNYFIRMYFTPSNSIINILSPVLNIHISMEFYTARAVVALRPTKQIIAPFPVKEIVPSSKSGPKVIYKFQNYKATTMIYFWCMTTELTSYKSINLTALEKFRVLVDKTQNWTFHALELYRVDPSTNGTHTCM
ncbi:unnamed protein product [Didymodactylos carnosus]|uniref:Uncharacterized protein n=1 Tax=Didymodactylos carnosus TaxID=1234261 RepID=A0A815GH92_9BILA|nr:unnamed protein product [Didymodactylos carnosus]CAF4199540.1 unnamed protein product [Didymodactylos carnosus]